VGHGVQGCALQHHRGHFRQRLDTHQLQGTNFHPAMQLADRGVRV
jgi:hypothetical protein